MLRDTSETGPNPRTLQYTYTQGLATRTFVFEMPVSGQDTPQPFCYCYWEGDEGTAGPALTNETILIAHELLRTRGVTPITKALGEYAVSAYLFNGQQFNVALAPVIAEITKMIR